MPQARRKKTAPKAAKPEKKQRDNTPVNAAGHWIYLRTQPDDEYRTSDGLRGFAPGAPISEDNDVIKEQVAKAREDGFVLDKTDYDEQEDLGYEIHPSDRDPIVETAAEAVAAGNNSLAPGGGLEDGPPPRGDAPGFGFEGAVSLSDLNVPPNVAVTGASPEESKPPIADEPAITTPEPPDPDKLVAPEAKDDKKEGKK